VAGTYQRIESEFAKRVPQDASDASAEPAADSASIQ
jgi:hypothetical protein